MTPQQTDVFFGTCFFLVLITFVIYSVWLFYPENPKTRTCQTCSHWKHNDSYVVAGNKCSVGTCVSAIWQSKPFAADMVQTSPELRTWENFGCLRHHAHDSDLEYQYRPRLTPEQKTAQRETDLAHLMQGDELNPSKP